MAQNVAEADVAVGNEGKPSRDFHHPYTPYDIQETFMSTVYEVLDRGKVGILESPTGTVSVFHFLVPHVTM